MKNITIKIKKAIQTDVPWKIDQFYIFLEAVRVSNLKVSYWDNEENWATLLSEKITVGYLWRKYPLLLLLIEHESDMVRILSEFEYVVPILVANLVTEELIIDPDPLLIDRVGELEYGQPLSATDIWFYTT
ncbi:hypothetical protein [Mucilaginibacter lappiensis]|uniref:Thiol-disulfide isomerase/thioredoxin n=1 Tax=Mucilaginibacter lappiensis TaxID=354630 RepID=A0A841J6C1_9SPHI|nr:hypothetical protein [Mucilaginibacter lappiensis]MBB6126347.1 thiol-disulfide isomerase/thioredoxin [Mucilaginibacter lappiensis]